MRHNKKESTEQDTKNIYLLFFYKTMLYKDIHIYESIYTI